MVGKLVGATGTHWQLKTAKPNEYVWKLPKRAWPLFYRIVGYRRGDLFVSTAN
jgi:hypothetical protein